MSRLDESRTETTRDDYQTPPEVIARVKEVLGEVTLDPFSDDTNPVGALYYMTELGLETPWYQAEDMTVYCNPPYGAMLLPFAKKVVAEAGKGCEIITLTPARSDTRWYDELVSNADCYAEIRGRIRFYLDGKPAMSRDKRTGKMKPSSAQFPCTLCYFGSEPGAQGFQAIMGRARFARLAKVL